MSQGIEVEKSNKKKIEDPNEKAPENVLTKKLLGKDKKLRAQIKSANFLKKTSDKYTKLHHYLTDETAGYWNMIRKNIIFKIPNSGRK